MPTPKPPPDTRTPRELLQLQRRMAGVLFSPLNARWAMQRRTVDGSSMAAHAASFIKPNDRLTSFERLEIYNRQYWYRLLDCLYDDYPGVRLILGERRFMQLAKGYLDRFPSRSPLLRELGRHLPRYITMVAGDPAWHRARPELLAAAREMARFEWAQIVAFDGGSLPGVTCEDLALKSPSDLRFSLQPHLTLLKVDYAVDELIALAREEDALRSEASQAVGDRPHPARARSRLPPRRKTWLAVYRLENTVYFKRLAPEAYTLLRALGRGLPLDAACEAVRRSIAPEQIHEWFACWSYLGWLALRPC